MTELSLEHKKIWVLGLLFNCPTGLEKNDCKINQMRTLSAKDREEKVFEMSEKELDDFIEDHQCCMKNSGF